MFSVAVYGVTKNILVCVLNKFFRLIQFKLWNFNRPLPSSKNRHFQNEAKCKSFLVKMSLICIRMKNHFYIKGWALNLVLIQLGNGLLMLCILLDP